MTDTCIYSLKRIVDPVVSVASAADVRAWARMTDPSNLASDLAAYEDSLIDERIQSATEMCESFADRSLCSQTWQYRMEHFPSWQIELPKGPWQTVTWIKYYDEAGTLTTLSSAEYIFDDVRGYITPIYSGTWPSTQYRINAVEVKYVSGYGATPSSVPAIFKDAICSTVLDWLENRRNQFELPNGVKEKLKTMWSGHF